MLQRPAQQTWASNLSKAPCSFSEYNPLSPIPPSLLLSWSPPLSTFSRDSWGFRTRKELQHSLVHSSIPTSFYRAKPWGPQRGNTANDQARTGDCPMLRVSRASSWLWQFDVPWRRWGNRESLELNRETVRGNDPTAAGLLREHWYRGGRQGTPHRWMVSAHLGPPRPIWGSVTLTPKVGKL